MTDTVGRKTQMPDEAVMRIAVSNRDATFDGVFVYGVLTTGVYCRPSCPSRAANPRNTRFFRDASAAQSAGLRACKRCDPGGVADRNGGLMQEIARYIERHGDQALSLKTRAKQAQLSPAYLQRLFKRASGVSPKAYHDAARLRLSKGALKSGRTVSHSINEAGFQSTSRVYGRATRTLGMTPSTYRSGGVGETITYAFRDTTLGPLLMAATERGVCFAHFGKSEQALVDRLQTEFPRAIFQNSDATQSPALDAWIEALEAHVGGSAPRPDVPVDLRGTAFQIRVWRFLVDLPEGDVLSYAEVAAGIDAPKSMRAAAAACAANRIAILVPCHRVLRSDGGLGGYRWGLERKRVLIDQERVRRSP